MLKRHLDEVIYLVCEDSDEIIFFQSDNGKLDTKADKTWMVLAKILQRFTSAYSSSMNGFVERVFRSVRDLALSMIMAALLPEPNWETADRHACLLACIRPNQSSTG